MGGADGGADGNGWFVYEVQVSQWSNRRTLSFTVNVGIYSDVLAAFGLWQRPKDRVPGAMYCCYQQRIGRLMPSKLDEWWDVHSRRDAAPVGEALARLTERRVIPHLERVGSYADLLKTFERPPAGFRPMW